MLLCRVHQAVCALQIHQVIETLRPLPLEPLARAPSFVCGVAILRGVPVPVVDLGLLLAAEQVQPSRFVALRVGARTVAIAVSAVIGVRALGGAVDRELPPLLRDAAGDLVRSLASLDRELLLVLDSGRLVPDELLARLESPGRPS
ncbi:MAG: chemotaxis protein CheW [Deltaproteobacteria bacterium]